MKLPEMKIGELKIKVPIIQGGMGVGVSRSSLAAAVTNAGGLGIISGAQIGFEAKDFKNNPLVANIRCLKEEIIKAKEKTNGGAIGVNLMVAMKNYREMVQAAVEAKVDVIISGAGLPIDLPKFVKASNVKIVPIVSSLKAARVIINSWQRNYEKEPDAIIVEGSKAGGHLGFKYKELIEETAKPLEEITTDILNYLKKNDKKIPVIPAGGIFTGQDIAKYLKLGASGVQMATRFVTTVECDASEAYKNAYINAKEEDIKITQSPVGMPGRAVNNVFIQHIEKEGKDPIKECYQCLEHCDPKTIPYCITSALINAVEGNLDHGLIFTGSNAYRCDKIVTVQALMDELVKEIIAV